MIFRKAIKWRKESKEWHREHTQAWGRVFEKNKDGLNLFQIEIESRIISLLGKSKFGLVNRKLERTYNEESDWMITARIPNMELDIWIYDNQIDISGADTEFSVEEWDVKTPNEYYERAEQFLNKAIKKTADNA